MSDIQPHNRQSFRLKDHDYSTESAYFITLITYHRVHLFGSIMRGEMQLNPSGMIAYEQWVHLGKRFTQSDFSSFVIMPNHVHGIVFITSGAKESTLMNQDLFTPQPNRKKTNNTPLLLGTIVQAYKASVTFRINALRGFTHTPVWQRNYYEKIIYNQIEYENIWKYIIANPDRWEEDQLHR